MLQTKSWAAQGAGVRRAFSARLGCPTLGRTSPLLSTTKASTTYTSSGTYGLASSSSGFARVGQLPRWACRATVDPIPAGLQIEVKEEDGTKEVDYDEEKKVVRIPLSAMGDGARRSKLVLFTCNKCGGRSARLVNPVAWEKGVVFGQCSKCSVWHVLQANNKKIFEEVRYKEDPEYADKDGLDAAKAEELLKQAVAAEEPEPNKQ